QLRCSLQPWEARQSLSFSATQIPSLALHWPFTVHSSEPLQSLLEATTQLPCSFGVHLPSFVQSGFVLQRSGSSQARLLEANSKSPSQKTQRRCEGAACSCGRGFVMGM